MIGGGELKIYLTKMEAIMKWSVPTDFSVVRSFDGVTQYLRKVIASFLVVVAPLHTITMSTREYKGL